MSKKEVRKFVALVIFATVVAAVLALLGGLISVSDTEYTETFQVMYRPNLTVINASPGGILYHPYQFSVTTEEGKVDATLLEGLEVDDDAPEKSPALYYIKMSDLPREFRVNSSDVTVSHYGRIRTDSDRELWPVFLNVFFIAAGFFNLVAIAIWAVWYFMD